MISDNYMKYDTRKHRYVLTNDYVREVMNVELSDVLNTSGSVADTANMPEIVLDRVSMLIYGYIYRNSAYTNRQERELALDGAHRPHLMDAMTEELTYILNNGDVSAFSGVNAVSGLSIDPIRMRQAEIAPLARDIIESRGLVSRGVQWGMRDIAPTYEEDGY